MLEEFIDLGVLNHAKLVKRFMERKNQKIKEVELVELF